jgi:hypothetical protein
MQAMQTNDGLSPDAAREVFWSSADGVGHAHRVRDFIKAQVHVRAQVEVQAMEYGRAKESVLEAARKKWEVIRLDYTFLCVWLRGLRVGTAAINRRLLGRDRDATRCIGRFMWGQ